MATGSLSLSSTTLKSASLKSPIAVIVMAFLMAVLSLQIGCQQKADSQAGSKDHTEIEKSALEAEQADEDISKLKASSEGAKSSDHSSRTPSATGSKSAKSKHSREHTKENKKDVSYFVQVGTFKVEENASKVLKQLKDKGLPGMMKRIEKDNGLVLYAVRLEPTPKKSEAESMLPSVKEATGQSGLVVSARE